MSKRAEARAIWWQSGEVAAWYLRKYQEPLHDFVVNEKRPFIECSRRIGKTTSVLTFVLEMLRRNPGWICRWCFPDKGQAHEVLTAEMNKIQADIPDSERFQYMISGSKFVHANGSILYLRGVNHDRGESARGAAANIIVADEYGFWNEPDYIVREVLGPQLKGQEGQWFIKASTPPRDLGHLYYTEREEAVRDGRFIQLTILDDTSMSPEEHAQIIKDCGGVNSPSYQREYLCQPVSDPESLVVREWSDDLNIVPNDYPRPKFFTPYVGGDSGADDNTFLLFGYYDFLEAEIIIEDEIVMRGETTETIVATAKLRESELWNWNPHVNYRELERDMTDASKRKRALDTINEIFATNRVVAHRRVYDAPKQLIYDIFGQHQWSVQMPQKDQKDAAIHGLRQQVGARKFRVKRRCTQVARQLKVGMWKDDKHTDFQRSEGLGHLDGIAAAIYFNRCVDRNLNPWPLDYGLSRQTHFINPVAQRPPDKSEAALAGAFGRKGFP